MSEIMTEVRGSAEPRAASGHGACALVRRHRTVLLICCLAVVVRLGFAWFALPALTAKTGLAVGASSDGYDHLARSLLAGCGYRFRPQFGETLFRLPGYPLFLCGMFEYLFNTERKTICILPRIC